MKTLALYACFVVVLVGSSLVPLRSEARDKDDCMSAWSQAVRSYLTTNRRAGPDGKEPVSMDEQELQAQAWNKVFTRACDLDADGRKGDARVEAATTGVQVLAKIDSRGCARFLEYYMGVKDSEQLCSMAQRVSMDELREQVAAALPVK